MIKIRTDSGEYKELTVSHFADGTMDLRLNADDGINEYNIVWLYESEEEMAQLYFIVRHLRTYHKTINLTLPYVPNARQDRVQNACDIFTLKYFAEWLNALKFAQVEIFDPHSAVTPALITNVKVLQPGEAIEAAIRDTGEENILMFYPDEGAVKRYSEMVQRPYSFGVKSRDWVTRRIKGFRIELDDTEILGRPVMLVDDICGSGGTIRKAAEKLKEAGVGKIYVYVSHCENGIVNGSLLDSGLIECLYTSNSTLRATHPRIKLIKEF